MSQQPTYEPRPCDEYSVMGRTFQFTHTNEMRIIWHDAGFQMCWLPDEAVRALAQVFVDRGLVKAVA